MIETNFSYSIPYLIFLLYLFVLVYYDVLFLKKNINNLRIRIFTILGFLFFFGLRGFVFSDFVSYYKFFDNVPTIWNSSLFYLFENNNNLNYEPGFVIYTYFVKSIIPNYFGWIFVSVLIDIILLDVIIRRYSKFYVLAFILYFVFGGEAIEFNLMRNVKAILIFLYSLKYIEEHKPVKYFSLNLLALSFHTSAIVFFPLYYFLNKSIDKKVLWFIFSFGVFFVILQIRYLEPIFVYIGNMIGGNVSLLVNIYFSSEFKNIGYGVNFGTFERIFTFFLIVFFYDKLKEKYRGSVLFLNMYVGFFIIYFYFSEISVILERFSYLFIASYWILYPNILSLVENKVKKYFLFFYCIVIAVLKTYTQNTSVIMKYDNVLWGISNYEIRKDIVFWYYGK